jgi:hypothetical protein
MGTAHLIRLPVRIPPPLSKTLPIILKNAAQTQIHVTLKIVDLLLQWNILGINC